MNYARLSDFRMWTLYGSYDQLWTDPEKNSLEWFMYIQNIFMSNFIPIALFFNKICSFKWFSKVDLIWELWPIVDRYRSKSVVLIPVHRKSTCTKFCVDTDIFEEVINDKLISGNMYLCMGAMGNLGSIVTILNIINL